MNKDLESIFNTLSLGGYNKLKQSSAMHARRQGEQEEAMRYTGLADFDSEDTGQAYRAQKAIKALLGRTDIPNLLKWEGTPTAQLGEAEQSFYPAVMTRYTPHLGPKKSTLSTKATQVILGKEAYQQEKQMGVSNLFGLVRGEEFGGRAPANAEELKKVRALRDLIKQQMEWSEIEQRREYGKKSSILL